MTPEQWKRLQEHFHQAIPLSPDDRAAFLARLAAADEEVAAQLAALLKAADEETKSRTWPAIRLPIPKSARFAEGQLILNRFRVIRFLGQGGMGEVYEADDLQVGRVALKTHRAGMAGDPHMLSRFRQEVQSARKVTSPYVCRIHELFTLPPENDHENCALLTMELLEGRTLADRIDQEGPLPLAEAEALAQQLCAGLEAIHNAGVIHRDFKSRNVMLAQRGECVVAVVMDFGLARHALASAAAAGSGATVVGSVIGTPQSMAPEQFIGAAVTHRIDIYALGIVLYEMVTGRLPFDSTNLLAAAAERAKRPATPSSLRAGLSAHWDAVIDRCLQFEPERRFGSAAEVALALRNPPLPLSFISRHAKPALLGLLTAIAAVVALLGWPYFQNRIYTPSPEAQYWYDEGTSALRAGTFFKASLALQRAVEKDPRFVMAHVRLADAYNETDLTAKAQHEMLTALDAGASPTPSERLYAEAVSKTILHDLPAALTYYRKILTGLPESRKAEGYLDLGRCLEKLGNIDQAIQAYARSAQLNPQDPAPFLRLGVLQSRQNQTRRAEQSFAQAEDLYGNTSNVEGAAEVNYQRGWAANSQQRPDDARKFLARARHTAEDLSNIQLQVRVLAALSITESLAANADESAKLATQAIQLAQNNGLEYWAINGLIGLGTSYFVREDFPHAESYLNQALQLAQRTDTPRLQAYAKLQLASLRDQQDKPREVIPLAQAALDYYKGRGFINESIDGLTLLSRAKLAKAEFGEAVSSASDLLKLAEDTKSPARILGGEETLGIALLNLEQYPKALPHLKRAVEISLNLPYYYPYHAIHLAHVLGCLGGGQEAERILQTLPPAALLRHDIKLQRDCALAQIRISKLDYESALNKALTAMKVDESYAESECQIRSIAALADLHSGAIGEAERLSNLAIAEAERADDKAALGVHRLARAQILLHRSSLQAAKEDASAAYAFFSSSGLQDSAWRALTCLSKIEKQLGQLDSSASDAKKAMDILSDFRHNWPNDLAAMYMARPDVKLATRDLRQLIDHSGGRR